MLIINADDFGKIKAATERIVLCHKSGRITSATAMMFMADSDRSARLAKDNGIETGLHLNLTDQFTGNHEPHLARCQQRVSQHLRNSRFAPLLFNPLLRNEFEYTCRSQWERFEKIYGRPPSHLDGHHHMHICANVLFSRFIPARFRVRRNFHFTSGEKGMLNRLVRRIVDRYIEWRFVSTDYFFSIKPFENRSRIRGISELARRSNVELMVHPDEDEEFIFLMSNEFRDLIADVETGGYSALTQDGKRSTIPEEPSWTIERR
ncbi:MAG: ChbG/HpnK family deacetylase [Acidobacteria bacterium]|nr:ChbG/HpnK family deacetylase [Acidobacteriota bacterium]